MSKGETGKTLAMFEQEGYKMESQTPLADDELLALQTGNNG